MSPTVSADLSARGAQGTDQPAYDHDVFISCDDSDTTWVDEELLKPLRDAGLSVCVEWDFPGGADKEAERGRAVTRSRHTLLVLSDAWCHSHVAEDDVLLV